MTSTAKSSLCRTSSAKSRRSWYISYLSVTLPPPHIVECQKQIAAGTLDRILELLLDLYFAQRRDSFSNCRKELDRMAVCAKDPRARRVILRSGRASGRARPPSDPVAKGGTALGMSRPTSTHSATNQGHSE